MKSKFIKDAENERVIEEDSGLFFFSEEKYIKEKPDEYDESRRALLREMPTVESISEFINALYECAQFSTECCIICLVYINRIISFTDMPLKATNWRPLVLCALLVAQKVSNPPQMTFPKFFDSFFWFRKIPKNPMF